MPWSPMPPHFITQNQDMSHDTIDFGLVEIEPQPCQKSGTL